MRLKAFAGAVLLALAVELGATDASWAASPPPIEAPVKAGLVAETGSIAPGETVWVALHLAMRPGWHVYWRNPGDAGLPPEIAWTLPPGFTAGEISWPTPERFVIDKLGNYGYAGAVDLLVPLTARLDQATAGPIPDNVASIKAHASWLVCSDICIPGEADLALALPVRAATGGPDPANAALFAAARARLPRPAGFPAQIAVSGTDFELRIPKAALASIPDPTVSFFPNEPNIIDAAVEPRTQASSDRLDLLLRRASGPTAATVLPASVDGVLALRGRDGTERSYAISAQVIAAAAPDPAGAEPAFGWWRALLLAFAGGVILNLMPCVFPILSLKLLGLAVAVHRAAERRHGFAYAAGVVLSFAALGGLLLALRAGGAAIGWGFQLQSPVVVALLAFLLFAMGLSLSGVAEFGVGLGGGLGGIGGRFVERTGVAGAFATGVLATIVASPCTAPFMGTALGYAMLAGPGEALAVFVALGAGLAAPVVLATAVPGVALLLPRPGPWMLWFKQLLAFPLYLTAAWLIWVLLQQIAPGDGFLALLGLVLIGFAAWIYGRTRYAEPTERRFGLGLAATGFAAALAMTATLAPSPMPASAGSRGTDGLAYETFGAERLDRLVAEKTPVFVNLTAAWCITCLVNERTLDSAAVRRAIAAHEIVPLKGDWTRQDPEITALLQKFGRSGVPLYLLYDRGGSPKVLPQILTEATVLDAIGRI
jgi:thiol:disulfide interchange protein DsbD